MKKNELLEKIADVFRSHGYEGATLTRLAEATGLKRASLYHRFPGGKEEMAREVMKMIGDQVRADLFSALEDESLTPEERLQAWVEASISFYHGGAKNCMLGAMLLSGGDHLFEPELRLAMQRWITSIANVLQLAGANEALASERARYAVERIQGGLIVARALGEPNAFANDVRQLPETLLKDLKSGYK